MICDDRPIGFSVVMVSGDRERKEKKRKENKEIEKKGKL